jgi:formiminoglutamase
VLNAGDLVSAGRTNETHGRLTEVVAVLRSRFPAARVVVIGGSDDHVFGEVMGLAEHLSTEKPEARLALLSIDAHADAGAWSGEAPAGTAIRRLLEDGRSRLLPSSVCLFGLQPACCPEMQTEWLVERGARLVWLDDDTGHEEGPAGLIAAMGPSHQGVCLSIDLDALPQSEAPGVSSPSPLGLAVPAVLKAARALGALDRPTQLGIWGLNPRFDRDGATARLAALTVWTYLLAARP